LDEKPFQIVMDFNSYSMRVEMKANVLIDISKANFTLILRNGYEDMVFEILLL
jgi:hypothetical protein